MDYKKYSLENLENWLHDAMSCAEATPQEIYDTIHKVVEENYYTYKHQTSQAYKLLALLNGNGGQTYEDVVKEKEYYEPSMPPWGHSDLEYGIHHKEPLSCDKDDSSPECKGAWNSFWEENHTKSHYDYTRNDSNRPNPLIDKVVKWQLPVEMEPSGEYFVTFPDDLLEAANLNEGDTVEWVDNNTGSYTFRKITKPLGM